MAAVTNDTTRRGGRPPDLDNRRAVLDATRRKLAEVGYSALTIDGVAKEAGLYRLLIYRTWETKQALVIDALFGDIPDAPTPDTGNLRDDLLLFLEQQVSLANRREHLLGFPGLTVELRLDPELGREVHTKFTKPLHDSLHWIFERALRRGEISQVPNIRLFTPLVTYGVHALASTNELDPTEYAQYLTTLFLDGVID